VNILILITVIHIGYTDKFLCSKQARTMIILLLYTDNSCTLHELFVIFCERNFEAYYVRQPISDIACYTSVPVSGIHVVTAHGMYLADIQTFWVFAKVLGLFPKSA